MPLLADGQVSWRDLVFGAGSYRVSSIEGWEDLPALDDASVLRSGAHGSDVGQLLAQSRTITVEVRVVAPDDGGAAIRTLVDRTGLSDDLVEEPLAVSLWGRTLMVRARLVRRAIPVGRDYSTGVTTVPLQWQASDPRRYAPDEQTASTGLPSPEPGLDWGTSPAGLDWTTAPGGLDWGPPGSSGVMSCVAEGNAPTHPVITITGPVQTPGILNVGTGARLEYDLVLAAGDVLTIDTGAGTVTLGGADRLSSVTARSTPEQAFVLSPGETVLAYRSADLAATASVCTVAWQSAYW
ncbi:phage distal tail protein [Yinghuangia aomiensis]